MRRFRRWKDGMPVIATVLFLAACSDSPKDDPRMAAPGGANRVSSHSSIDIVDLGDASVAADFSRLPNCLPDHLLGDCRLGSGFRAVAINQPGDVAIQALSHFVTTSPTPAPFVWRKGTFQPLGSAPGIFVRGINNQNEAVGQTLNSAVDACEARGYRFANGVWTELPLGGALASRASAINDNGDIVGARIFPSAASSGCVRVIPHATLWRRNGDIVDLGALVPGRGSEAFGVNNDGVAVGISGSGSPTPVPTAAPFRAVRPVKFEGGSVTDLGGSPTCSGEAYAINERGQAAGKLCDHATLWDGGNVTTLPTPLGALESAAMGINNSGAVVGRFLLPAVGNPYQPYTFYGPALGESWVTYITERDDARFAFLPVIQAALWRDGQLTVLPTLKGTFREYGAAYAVNDKGQIAGADIVDDQLRAVLWSYKGPLK
jgi:uncharacterized membrane protein